MDCEFCTDPAVEYDVDTPFGPRSLCGACLRSVRNPPSIDYTNFVSTLDSEISPAAFGKLDEGIGCVREIRDQVEPERLARSGATTE
jgi:hypothetical protein